MITINIDDYLVLTAGLLLIGIWIWAIYHSLTSKRYNKYVSGEYKIFTQLSKRKNLKGEPLPIQVHRYSTYVSAHGGFALNKYDTILLTTPEDAAKMLEYVKEVRALIFEVQENARTIYIIDNSRRVYNR